MLGVPQFTPGWSEWTLIYGVAVVVGLLSIYVPLWCIAEIVWRIRDIYKRSKRSTSQD